MNKKRENNMKGRPKLVPSDKLDKPVVVLLSQLEFEVLRQHVWDNNLPSYSGYVRDLIRQDLANEITTEYFKRELS